MKLTLLGSVELAEDYGTRVTVGPVLLSRLDAPSAGVGVKDQIEV